MTAAPHFDAFEIGAAGVEAPRTHVGCAFEVEQLPGEDADAFRANVDRRARALGFEAGALVLLRTVGGRQQAIILVRMPDDHPAPLPADRRRGKRGGKKQKAA